MRLSDFNRYAGDFEKRENIRRQGSNDSQALNAQASMADIRALNRQMGSQQQMITSSTSSSGLSYGGLGELLPLSSRGIFKGLDDD